MANHKPCSKWVAFLSNGAVITEGEGDFNSIPFELSPWQRLQIYIKEKGLSIVGMQIKTEDRTYTLPTSSKRFGGGIPLSYRFGRRVFSEAMSDNPKSVEIAELYIFIVAVYEKFEVCLWVDEIGLKDSWVSVKLLD